MTERGYFKVDRGVWSHPVFAAEQFTEREAWLWLIARAAWKPRGVPVGQLVVHIERGQLAVSSRYLAEAWRWGKSTVARFLAKLKDAGMIDTRHGRDATVITLCNYEKYQLAHGGSEGASEGENRGTPNGTPNGTSNGAPNFPASDCSGEEIRLDLRTGGTPNGAPDGTPSGTKIIKDKNKERDSDAGASPSSRKGKSLQRPDYPAEFLAFFGGYPRTKTTNPKLEAFRVWERLSAEDRALAAASLPIFAEHCSNQWKGYQPPGAAVFLRNRRFDDFATSTPTATADPAKARAQLRTLAECHFRGEWRPGWGAPPGEPGCTIPTDVIAEAARATGKPWPAVKAAGL